MEIMLVSMHALTLQQLSDLPLTLRMSTIKAAAKSIPPTTVSPTRPEQHTRSRNQTSLAVGSYFNTYNSFLCRLWPSTKTYVTLSIGKALLLTVNQRDAYMRIRSLDPMTMCYIYIVGGRVTSTCT